MSKLKSLLFLTISFGVVGLIVVLPLIWDHPMALQNAGPDFDYQRTIAVCIFSYVGIISNSIYDKVLKKSRVPLFKRREIIYSAIVAPIVILPIYKSLGDSTDILIICLTSYQNGFFFDSLFEKIRKSSEG